MKTMKGNERVMTEVEGTDDMSVSANALTEKLFTTVLDLFGSYAPSDTDDDAYNRFLERLQQNEGRVPKKKVDLSGAVALMEPFLLRGYVLQDNKCCENCFLPMLEKNGVLVCALPDCQEINANPIAQVLTSGSSLSTTSGAREAKRELEVNKQMKDFNERRSEATKPYTEKILAGYMMVERPCPACEMPMMKRPKDGAINCVFCPKTTEVTPPKIAEMKHAENKKTTKAEQLALKLKSVQPNQEDVAEQEMMELLARLGNEGKETRELIGDMQEFFEKRKKERTAAKKEEKSEAVAEVATHDDNRNKPTKPEAVSEVITNDDNRNEPANVIDVSTTPLARAAITPEHVNKSGCSLTENFLTSLKSLFTSSCGPKHFESEVVEKPTRNSFDIEKKVVAAMAKHRREMSADNCPSYNMAQFEKDKASKCAALNAAEQEDETKDKESENTAEQRDDIEDKDGESAAQQEDETQDKVSESDDYQQKMIQRLLSGWAIVDGKSCASCTMPIMEDTSSLTHCLTHGVVNEQGIPLSFVASFATEFETMPKVPKSKPEPGPRDGRSELQVSTNAEPHYYYSDTSKKDPSPSYSYLRGNDQSTIRDPTPSMQGLKCVANKQLNSKPAPSVSSFHLKHSDPTPNMNAIRNKYLKNSAPTPDMPAVHTKGRNGRIEP